MFLQNHGLIISSDDPAEVIELTEKVTLAFERHIHLDLMRYRQVTPLQNLLAAAGYPHISMVCNDDSIIKNTLNCEKQELEIWPFCPDTLIYCGVRPVFLNNKEDLKSINAYIDANQDHPNVLILDNDVYFCAQSLKKAKEAQDLFKFHLLVSSQNKEKTQRLHLNEIAYLSNWDAEKYRQGI